MVHALTVLFKPHENLSINWIGGSLGKFEFNISDSIHLFFGFWLSILFDLHFSCSCEKNGNN